MLSSFLNYIVMSVNVELLLQLLLLDTPTSPSTLVYQEEVSFELERI